MPDTDDMDTVQPDSAPKGVGLSESAVNQLNGLFAAEDRDGLMLRIVVNGGGCSGFTYGFDFDDAADGLCGHRRQRDQSRFGKSVSLSDANYWADLQFLSFIYPIGYG